MELAPVPRGPRLTSRGRMLLALAVFTPITLFALLPAVLGLQRYVVADDAMQGGIDRGSLVIERSVPASDLRERDVITFRPDGHRDGALVTRRIVNIRNGVASTRGDARNANDAWQIDLSEGTYSRVMVSVPWVGLPFVSGVGRGEAAVLLVVPSMLLAGASVIDLERRRARRAAAAT